VIILVSFFSIYGLVLLCAYIVKRIKKKDKSDEMTFRPDLLRGSTYSGYRKHSSKKLSWQSPHSSKDYNKISVNSDFDSERARLFLLQDKNNVPIASWEYL